jgi:predicted SnoaL-like aldol condensation-catalyzing enzyme
MDLNASKLRGGAVRAYVATITSLKPKRDRCGGCFDGCEMVVGFFTENFHDSPNDSKRFTYSIADVLRSVVMNASDPGKY